MLKKMIKKFLPRKTILTLINVKSDWLDSYGRKSYSQEGEDLILWRLFEGKSVGFYIDVGAHHPKRFSNTYLFYKKGWSGINIDAMPGSMEAFDKERPRDINIEVPISDKPKLLTYYAFNEPALNGFSQGLSKARDGLNDYKIIFTKEIETQTLDSLLEKKLPKDQEIDFLTIDVEGLDLQVLKSINLEKYKPAIILVEILGSVFEELLESEIYQYMKDNNYQIHAKCLNTVFFKRKTS